MKILWNSYRLHSAVSVGSLTKKNKNKNRNFEYWFFSRQTNSLNLKRQEKGKRSNIAQYNIFYTLTIWPNVGEEKKTNTLYFSKILLIRHPDDFIDPPRHAIQRLKLQPVFNIHMPLNIFSWFGFNFKLSHGFGGWQLGYYSGPIITSVFFLIGGFSYRKLNNRVIPLGNKTWYDNAYKFSPLGGILDTWIYI